jgi:tRNA dimethylallyltransferase
MTLDVVVIVGPTACGKTRLAVEVAHRLGSEIVSADARQVYRGLDIGTGKDFAEYERVTPPVPCHLIDVADPEEVYTLFRYQQDCYGVLREMARRPPFTGGGKPVVLAGGSGLYVEAVVCDYRLADVPRSPAIRARLGEKKRWQLIEELRRRAPDLAVQTDLSSSRRLIRALEIAEHRERQPVRYGEPPGLILRFTVFGIEVERTELRGRIARRLQSRFEEGMIEEVQSLLDRGLSLDRLDELGLEYREIGAHLSGKKSRQEMISDLEIAIGRFAKRQQTWFRGMERRGVAIRWIGPEDADIILETVGANGSQVLSYE